jgi:hypothetical protein
LLLMSLQPDLPQSVSYICVCSQRLMPREHQFSSFYKMKLLPLFAWLLAAVARTRSQGARCCVVCARPEMKPAKHSSACGVDVPCSFPALPSAVGSELLSQKHGNSTCESARVSGRASSPLRQAAALGTATCKASVGRRYEAGRVRRRSWAAERR